MNLGIIISLSLHACALLGGLFLFRGEVKPYEETKIIPIEMVTIDELTNIKAAVKRPKKVETPEPEAKPMTLETPMKNAEEKGELQERVEDVASETVAMAEAPTPDVSEEKIEVPETPAEPEKPEEVDLDALAEIVNAAENPDITEAVIEVPDVPAEPERPKEVDLDRLAGLINRVREQAPEVNQQRTLQSETNSYVFSETARQGAGEGNAMTMSELTALQSAMYKCWSIPAAAPNPAELIVPVKVSLFPDGYVNQVTLGNFRQINHFHKLAADEAIRAVNKCQPYDFLPAEKYSQWREMTLNFRPDV